MKRTTKLNQGFTLIELLVVISIIAILATIATPMIGKAKETARMTPVLANARSIVQGLSLFSNDHNGSFPEPTSENSNSALRQLFPSSFDGGAEKTFYVAQDRMFCRNQPPDGDISGEGDESKALEAGENHWSYVAGLTDQDDSGTPIIADGFTAQGTAGEYDKRHTFFKSKKAIIAMINGTANTEVLVTSGDKAYIKAAGKKTGNMFSPENLTETGTAKVLNPLPAPGIAAP